jgi:tetraacyldisaccharide 4'-kinase
VNSPIGWRETLVAHWQRPRPSWACRALEPLSWLYAALAAGHRTLYDSGLLPREHAPRPVIVVGNIVAGGAGKTPAVIAVVQLLRTWGWTPGVISRGYGRHAMGVQIVGAGSAAGDVGDEPVLIHRRTGVPVAVGAQRVQAARALVAAMPAIDVLVSDDGLQHHALARDVQVLVFDARGAGNGLRLPAGPLREPMPSRVPEASLVLYTDGGASTPLPGFAATRTLTGAVALADWWRGAPASDAALHALRGRPLVACAGTARPARFFDMLRAAGLAPQGIALPDHASFDVLPWPAGTPDVIVTEKDAVKLHPDATGATRVWVAPLDLQPEANFGPALQRLLPVRTPAR